MQITVINGSPTAKVGEIDNCLGSLSRLLEVRGHRLTLFNLGEMYLKHCTGCWGCWVKTPGECVFPDDTSDVRRAYINSDFILFASPVIMGFTSALLKRTQDKLIPLLHPYFEIDRDEIHHRPRYESYPPIGLFLEEEEDTDEEDLEIISAIYRRTALNAKSSLSFTKLTSVSMEEIADEIDRI